MYTVCQMKLRTKSILRIFRILQINRIMLFCNLFIERPSYCVNSIAVVVVVVVVEAAAVS